MNYCQRLHTFQWGTHLIVVWGKLLSTSSPFSVRYSSDCFGVNFCQRLHPSKWGTRLIVLAWITFNIWLFWDELLSTSSPFSMRYSLWLFWSEVLSTTSPFSMRYSSDCFGVKYCQRLHLSQWGTLCDCFGVNYCQRLHPSQWGTLCDCFGVNNCQCLHIWLCLGWIIVNVFTLLSEVLFWLFWGELLSTSSLFSMGYSLIVFGVNYYQRFPPAQWGTFLIILGWVIVNVFTLFSDVHVLFWLFWCELFLPFFCLRWQCSVRYSLPLPSLPGISVPARTSSETTQP